MTCEPFQLPPWSSSCPPLAIASTLAEMPEPNSRRGTPFRVVGRYALLRQRTETPSLEPMRLRNSAARAWREAEVSTSASQFAPPSLYANALPGLYRIGMNPPALSKPAVWVASCSRVTFRAAAVLGWPKLATYFAPRSESATLPSSRARQSRRPPNDLVLDFRS